jgi:hypothetical protein
VTVSHLLGRSKIMMTTRYAHSLADVKMALVRKLDLAGVGSVPDPSRILRPAKAETEESSSCSALRI